jgi:hypothetical protein
MTLRRRTSFAVVIAALGCSAIAALPSCEESETPQECTSIPPGGCPLSRGVACQDPACDAVYACRPGNVWELDRMCPPRDASVRDASGDAPREATSAFDASIDAPAGANGGPGCDSLQAPDCALGLALACPSGCCGCEDLYICENGGWTYYATCTE